jgi:hypothetical protein
MQYARARNFIFENILYAHYILFAKCVLLYLLKAYIDWKKYLKDMRI